MSQDARSDGTRPVQATSRDSRFGEFLNITNLNDKLLRTIADAGEKLGGEYIFDGKYLQDVVEEVTADLQQLVQALNKMTGGRYRRLQRVGQQLERRLYALLGRAETVMTGPPVLELEKLSVADADSCGMKMARLGEVAGLPGVKVPPARVVTMAATREFLQRQGIETLCVELRAAGPEDLPAASARLQQAVLDATLPRRLRRALHRAAKWLVRQGHGRTLAVRSSAAGEDGAVSFAGQYTSLLRVERRHLEEAYRRVVASLFSEQVMRYRRHHRRDPFRGEMAVGLMAMIEAAWGGVMYTLDPTKPQSDLLVVSAHPGTAEAVVAGRQAADRYFLRRRPPHELVDYRPAGANSNSRPEGGGPRPAPRLSEEQLQRLARVGRQIERYFRRAQDIEWVEDTRGDLYIVQARPLRLLEPARRRVTAVDTAVHPVLLRDCGEVACQGIGSGIVWNPARADAAAPPETAVIVAETASPRLAAWLPRAAAVVTDVGSTTGHLAAVAREFRVPTLVNTGRASQVLTPGREVTVDADDNAVYQGEVTELVRNHLLQEAQFEEKPEFRVLRRLLRLIAPLNLHDPNSAEFAMDNCRTVHDVIRFVHEMAVRELVSGRWWRRHGRARPRRLELTVPLDLVVIDLGGGVAAGAGRGLTTEDLRCRPLLIFLEALSRPGVWATGPAQMDLKGLLASSTRTPALGTPLTALPENNVALVTADYLCLNLKLGYHYNLVDCRLGTREAENHVYFRFAGGVTELSRRSRRARLLARILEQFDFVVEVSSDLVVGRLKLVSGPRLTEVLQMLGRLVGFTRQLDIYLRHDEQVEEYYQRFLAGDTASDLARQGGEHVQG